MATGFNPYLLDTKLAKTGTGGVFNSANVNNDTNPKVFTTTTYPSIVYKNETNVSKATAQEIYVPLDFSLLSRVNMYVRFGEATGRANGQHVIAYIGIPAGRPSLCPSTGTNRQNYTNNQNLVSLIQSGNAANATYWAGANINGTGAANNIYNFTYAFPGAAFANGRSPSNMIKAYINSWYCPAQSAAAAVTDPDTGDVITPAVGAATAVNAYVKYIEFFYKVDGVDRLVYTLG